MIKESLKSDSGIFFAISIWIRTQKMLVYVAKNDYIQGFPLGVLGSFANSHLELSAILPMVGIGDNLHKIDTDISV